MHAHLIESEGRDRLAWSSHIISTVILLAALKGLLIEFAQKFVNFSFDT